MYYYQLTQNSNLEIKTIKDLPKLKNILEALNVKPNFSELARNLQKDYRTIKKYYYSEGEIIHKRNKPSKIDKYKELLDQLLLNEENIQYFANKRILWQYIKDNTDLNISYSAFRTYILKNKHYNKYFTDYKNKTKKTGRLRIESKPGEQAQIDWKENITFTTKNGETVVVNILALILSYSRYKVYHLTLSKTQDTLLSSLTEIFEHIGGVPKEIVCDNMKTIMDEARTPKNKGKINAKFYQYSKDMNFKLKPCMAYSPETKGKVEHAIKLLDEIQAYNGKITLEELIKLIEKINNRWNYTVHGTTRELPALSLKKEKDFLLPLPHENIRNLYKISTSKTKVNKSAMVSYKGNEYSVPSEYINKYLTLQAKDNYLHIYDNMKLIVSHKISLKKLNYKLEHYLELSKSTWISVDNKKIESKAKDNLTKLGERFNG